MADTPSWCLWWRLVPKLMGHAAGTGELLELLEHIHTASQSIHWLSLELGAAALTTLLLS